MLSLGIGGNQDKLSMLVENVHLVQDQERTINRVGGFIRLQIPNQRPGVGICDSLYFSLISKNFLFIDRLILENREAYLMNELFREISFENSQRM